MPEYHPLRWLGKAILDEFATEQPDPYDGSVSRIHKDQGRMLFASIAALVIVAALILIIASSQSTRNYTPEHIEGLVRNIDFPAFLNLISTDHDAFLQRKLSSSALRQLRRKRTFVTLAYLKQLAAIATLLIEIGEAARRSSDPLLARAASKLANSAVRTRIMILKTYLECLPLLLFPRMEEFLRPTLISHYKDMHERFGLLRSLSQPVMIKAKLHS